MKSLVIVLLVLAVLSFLFLLINSLLMQECSILYEAWKKNPRTYRMANFILQASLVVLAGAAYNLKLFVGCGIASALVVAFFFIAFAYNKVIEIDVANRDW